MSDLSGLSRSELRGTRLARGSVSRARGAGSSYISTTSTSGSSPSVAEKRNLKPLSVRIVARNQRHHPRVERDEPVGREGHVVGGVPTAHLAVQDRLDLQRVHLPHLVRREEVRPESEERVEALGPRQVE